jgi:hypothetical protein
MGLVLFVCFEKKNFKKEYENILAVDLVFEIEYEISHFMLWLMKSLEYFRYIMQNRSLPIKQTNKRINIFQKQKFLVSSFC